MADQESGVPGGFGAKKGSGGGRVIEPYVPPTTSSDDGTYTDASGKPISREQAMASGNIDKPGEASTKLAQIGGNQRAGEISTQKPLGLEALKQAEIQASRADVARRQSEQGTTASEAFAIQRMLQSPTARFSSQESAQRGYELASRYDRSFVPEQVKAILAPNSVSEKPPSIEEFDFRGRTSYAGGMVSMTAEEIAKEQEFVHPLNLNRYSPFGSIQERKDREETLRPKKYVLISGAPLVKRNFEYTRNVTLPKYNIMGFGFGGDIPVQEGKTYIRPALFGRTLEAKGNIPTRKVTETDISTLSILGAGVIMASPLGVFRTTSALRGARVDIKPIKTAGLNQFKEFTKSETASLGHSDPWAKIPTMRQTAQAAGRELTRKIEFGRTFQEPTGAGVASMSGNQALISIQQTTQGLIRHQGAKYARGLQTIDRTSQEFRQSARAHVPAKSIAEQKAILSEAFGELKQTSSEQIVRHQGIRYARGLQTIDRTSQKSAMKNIQALKPIQTTKQVQMILQKTSLIPYALHKQVSKQLSRQAQIGAQMQRQTSSQKTKQFPVIVQRQKQLYVNLPMSIQAQTSAMKNIQALKPVQTTKQAQTQRLRAQNIPPRFESPVNPRKIKIEEIPRRMKTTSSSFLSKRSSILSGSRKFTTSLGGKTIKQLEAELKRKRKI